MARSSIRDMPAWAQQGYSWPKLKAEDIALLEAIYPPRCLAPHETVEDHLRYAGKVELIARLKNSLPAPPTTLNLSPEEQAEADLEEAFRQAEETQHRQD